MLDEGVNTRNITDSAAGTEFVEVMYAKNLEEAKACCGLLENENIPSRFQDDSRESPDRGIAIMVPESRLVEASEILASRSQDDLLDEEDEDVYAEDDADIGDADDDDLDDDDDDDFDDDLDDDDDDDDDTEESDDF